MKLTLCSFLVRINYRFQPRVCRKPCKLVMIGFPIHHKSYKIEDIDIFFFCRASCK